jgi:diguanylate cyclase (GGDEF)-like protein/PAS domain S-box-containing protein
MANVLIVEDNPANMKLASLLLLNAGHTVLRAVDAEAGLTLARAEKPDLILMDIQLPGMDGLTATALLKRDPATALIPVIALTALAMQEDREKSQLAGCDAYIAKPLRYEELYAAIDTLLAKGGTVGGKQSKSLASDAVTSPTATILIVDDEIQERKLLQALLRPEGYITLSAANGEEALALIAQRAPDLILLDVMMPGMDGYQLASTLKAEAATSTIPIIMITVQSERSARLAGLNAGAEEFLTKPVDRAELWLRVRNLLRLKALGDFLQNHNSIMEQQVQARTADLQRFRAAMDATADAIYLVDRSSMRFVHVNDAACRMQNQTRDELLARTPEDVHSISRAELECIYDKLIASGVVAQPLELEQRGKDGSRAWLELRRHAQHSGDRWTIVTLVRDVTERNEAENRVNRLNRVYAVLSGINAAIVRIRDRRELFKEACRIIVEHGLFTIGWIAVLDHATGNLIAVAQAGLPENLGVGSAFFNGSVGLLPGIAAEAALREKHAAIDNVIEDAPGLADAEYGSADRLTVRRAAIKLGAKSVIALPLVVGGETFGLITLYAPERDFFDEEETILLNELAGDIAFAIDHIDKQERIDYLAYYDVLTGLANRSLFLERVAQYVRSAVSGGHKLALFLIDLERFKNINDSLGRPAGDTLLKQVAEWLTRNAGDINLVARVGADHFAVLLPEVNREGDVARLLEKTMAAFLDHPFRLNDTVFRIALKLGVALFPDDGSNADTLFRNAEAALKKAKASGERYLFYAQKMTETVAGKLTLENQLRQALDKGEFVLHYQPKVNLVSGKLTGAEALIRWNDPRTGLVPPDRFIPILEEIGLIYEVGRWALSKAIEDYLRWRTTGLAAVRIAVNVSPLQLRNRGFIAEIEQAIGIDAQAAPGLELEITESVIMQDIQHNIASLKAIRALGVRIAIDDFGTGFSSLSYLAKLPLDALKMDRSFVVDMTVTPEGLALASTIVNLAHSLKLKVVAEGVETEEQKHLLRVLNCDEMQGYLFSKPVPAEIFETRFLAPPPPG